MHFHGHDRVVYCTFFSRRWHLALGNLFLVLAPGAPKHVSLCRLIMPQLCLYGSLKCVMMPILCRDSTFCSFWAAFFGVGGGWLVNLGAIHPLPWYNVRRLHPSRLHPGGVASASAWKRRSPLSMARPSSGSLVCVLACSVASDSDCTKNYMYYLCSGCYYCSSRA